jgi:hypothetical protein
MKKRKFIRKTFEKWIYRFGLRWWDVHVVFIDEPDDIIKTFGGPDENLVLASTHVDWRYSLAFVDVNLPALMKLSEDAIERVVVHELCHVLINEMRERAVHHEERVATQLTKAIFWTVDDVEKQYKKKEVKP